jgi:hypothetical protein
MKRISIIVPVFNGYEFLNPFFEIFKKEINFDEIEFLIIDNNSSIEFLEALILKAQKYDFISVYSYNKKRSSYAARNFGFHKSKGELIAFTDFDCLLTEEYFKALCKINIEKDSLHAGKVELFSSKHNYFEVFDKLTYLKQEEYFNNGYAATANLVINRKIFNDVDGFREITSGGDSDFCKRSKQKGYGIIFNKNLIVKHPLRHSYVEHIKKAKRLGVGHGQVFILKNSSKIKIFLFLLKNIIGVLIPLHQLKLFFKILISGQINFKNIFGLFTLCFAVGSLQRIQIVKTILFK